MNVENNLSEVEYELVSTKDQDTAATPNEDDDNEESAPKDFPARGGRGHRGGRGVDRGDRGGNRGHRGHRGVERGHHENDGRVHRGGRGRGGADF